MEGFEWLVKSPGGIAGTTAAAVIAGTVMLRKFLLGDKVESASSTAHVDLIQRLSEAADRAEKRAEAAEARADLAYKERNDAYLRIGELGEQVRQLQAKVDTLQRTLDDKNI